MHHSQIRRRITEHNIATYEIDQYADVEEGQWAHNKCVLNPKEYAYSQKVINITYAHIYIYIQNHSPIHRI